VSHLAIQAGNSELECFVETKPVKQQSVLAQMLPHSARQTGQRPSFSMLPYFFILPTLILIGLVVVYPLVEAAFLSLTDASFVNPVPQFVALKNFVNILSSDTFWQVFGNTLVWTVSVVVFQFIVGLLTALLLNQNYRGRALTRALIILPWVTPGVIVALLWRMMYEPQLGIINGVLVRLGVMHQVIPWLAQISTAMPAVVVASIWKGSPFSTVMYLAALQGVSKEILDAAKIDGAAGFNQLRYVIIPTIAPVIRITVLLTTVWTANYFDLIYVMTSGGPLDHTHIFPTYIYELAFARAKTGMAAAYGLTAAAVLLMFSLLYIRELNSRKALD